TRGVDRMPWEEVVNLILIDLDDAASVLPWTQTEWGRVDKSVALGLKSRLALYAGSWNKFGYGKSAIKNATKAEEYFRISAIASKKVMDEGGRSLAVDFDDLFTSLGQMEADVKKET